MFESKSRDTRREMRMYATLFTFLAIVLAPPVEGIADAAQRAGLKTVTPVLTITVPKPKSILTVRRDSSGVYRFSVQGTVKGLPLNHHLLLWVRPVQPVGEGWYLQRPPGNGILTLRDDGSWDGVGQIGNTLYPPHNDDLVEIVVSIANESQRAKLMGASGVVIESQPLGLASVTTGQLTIRVQ